MIDTGYATFIEDCRGERAQLIGLVEALLGSRMNPGMPIAIPNHLEAVTQSTLEAFQNTLTRLNELIDAYDANPGA